MKSKRLLAALLCVMMMLTIMPVLNVAATTYAYSDVVGNGSTIAASWDFTKGADGNAGYNAITEEENVVFFSGTDGLKVVADSAEVFKNVIINCGSRPFNASRGVLFTAKMEGSEGFGIRSGNALGNQIYVDARVTGWTGLTGGDTFVPGNDWATYIIKIDDAMTGILVYGTKGTDYSTAEWTFIGGKTFHASNVGTTNNLTLTCGYDGGKGEATDGVCFSYFATIDAINTNYITESDLIPADWTATTDVDLRNVTAWPSDALIQPKTSWSIVAEQEGYQPNTVESTADGLNACQAADEVNRFKNMEWTTSDGSALLTQDRILKFTINHVKDNAIVFRIGMVGNNQSVQMRKDETNAGLCDYIVKLDDQGAPVLYRKKASESGYTLIVGPVTATTGTNKIESRGHNYLLMSCGYISGDAGESSTILSDFEVYENIVTYTIDELTEGLEEVMNADLSGSAMPTLPDGVTHDYAADSFSPANGGYSLSGTKNFTLGYTPVAEGRVITVRAKLADSNSQLNLRIGAASGRVFSDIKSTGVSSSNSANAFTGSSFAPGNDWVTYLIKAQGTGYAIYAMRDADKNKAKPWVLVHEIDSWRGGGGPLGLDNAGSGATYISNVTVWGVPKVVVTGTQEEIIGKAYVSDSVDLTQCTGAADDAMVSGQGVTAAKDGIVTYDATNGATVWTTADNYAAQVYGDWQWTNASWLPFSDTYKAIKMVAKAGDNAEIQIRAGRGTRKGVFVNIASTYVTTRKPVSGYVADTHNYDFGTGFNEILIVPGEDGYALWVRPEGSTDKYTQVFADAAYYTDERATFYAGNYKTGTISIKSVEALVGERTGSNILGTNTTELMNMSLTTGFDYDKYRFAKTTGATWTFSEDGLTFNDNDTEKEATECVAACYDYSALGGTKALKFTATMEEGGDLKLRIGASGKRAYANMTPSTVEIYSGTSSTPIVAKGVDGNNFAPGTTAQTYLIKTEGNGYAMYVQTDAVNDKWLMIAEADWWRNDGGQMKFETNSGKKVTLKDIVVYETATMAPVTLLDGYTATYVANGGALTDLNNRTVRAIVNPTANGKLVFAGYDADGKMVLANVYTVTAGTQEEKFFTAPKSNANIKTVKVFLWDDFEKMNSQYDMTAVTTR